MPIYEYSCQSCGKTIDVLQKVSDPVPEACSACGATGSLTKLVSRSSFVLKGGGWYADLYGSTKKDGASSSGPDASSNTPPASSSNSPPASSSSSPPASSSSSPPASSSSSSPSPSAAPAAAAGSKG